MNPLLPLLLKSTVALMILAIGLGSSAGDALYLPRRPGLLARSLLAMYVLVPLAALLITRCLPLTPAVRLALLVLAVSGGAPLLPRKTHDLGDAAYGFSLVIISAALAVLIVPAWYAWLQPEFATAAGLTPLDVAALLARSLFGPLAAGVLLRTLLGRHALPLARILNRLGGGVLLVAAVALIALYGPTVLESSGYGALALALLIGGALAIGHLLGGPAAGNRSVLAIACATRHIGIAVLVAAALPGPPTMVLVSTYVLTSAAASLPYTYWARHRMAHPA